MMMSEEIMMKLQAGLKDRGRKKEKEGRKKHQAGLKNRKMGGGGAQGNIGPSLVMLMVAAIMNACH